MRPIGDRGFTLVELMIGLVIGAVIAAGVYRVIVGAHRVTQAGTQQMDVRQNLRAGMTYVTSSLRELDGTDGDITAATPTRLQFRGMRWVGPLCASPAATGATAVLLPIRTAAVFGVRVPDATQDSILVFRDGDPDSRADDAWLVGAVTGTAGSACPDGAAAVSLTVEITAASGGRPAVLTGVTTGAPLRGFQQEEVSLFQGADSRWWVGQRTASRAGVWTPVRALSGPLEAGGLAFTYSDTTGTATAVLTDIASVSVIIRAESQLLVRGVGGVVDYARDSLAATAGLRNNARF
jgi:prepilin-type N-terminal cleavage/methylation domain-containing protein